MAFDNVRLDYRNVSSGPDPGRVYSIDHLNDVMVVKTNPGGTLVSTIPLDTGLQNEVLTLEYDGFFFLEPKQFRTWRYVRYGYK